MSISIFSEDSIFKAVCYSSVRFLRNKTKLACFGRRGFNHRDNNPIISTYKLDLGISQIIYRQNDIDHVININIFEKGPPVGLDGDTKIHYAMKISYINQIKDDSKLSLDTFKILEIFIDDCKNIYEKEIKDKDFSDKRIIFYIWDDYWEVYTKKVKRPLKTLCFDDNRHFKLLEECKKFLHPDTEKEYLEYGIPYKYNILLEGLPGTGKTSLIHSLSSELDMNIATITFDPEMTDIKFMRALKRIPENTIITLEDIDVLFKKRKDNEVSSALTFSGLLNCLDGMVSIHKQIIILTTNYCCNLDSALKRPGRIDNTIHFDYCSKKQIEIIFKKFYKKDDIDNYFKSLYEEVKYLKLTTAVLQGFFFRYRNEDYLENIEELKKTVELNKYDETSKNLYM